MRLHACQFTADEGIADEQSSRSQLCRSFNSKKCCHARILQGARTIPNSARQQHVLSSEVVDYIAVLDARMGEVYWAQYRYQNKAWQVMVVPTLSKAEEVRALVDSSSSANSLFVFALGQGVVLPEHVSLAESLSAPLQIACMPHARQIVQLALPDYLAGRGLDASQAQPLYLRNKIALTTAERMQLKAAS